MKSLGHEAWIEAYFRPQADSADAVLARQMPCECDKCSASRKRNALARI